MPFNTKTMQHSSSSGSGTHSNSVCTVSITTISYRTAMHDLEQICSSGRHHDTNGTETQKHKAVAKCPQGTTTQVDQALAHPEIKSSIHSYSWFYKHHLEHAILYTKYSITATFLNTIQHCKSLKQQHH